MDKQINQSVNKIIEQDKHKSAKKQPTAFPQNNSSEIIKLIGIMLYKWRHVQKGNKESNEEEENREN